MVLQGVNAFIAEVEVVLQNPYHCVIYIKVIKLASRAKYELIHRSSKSYRQPGYKNRYWHLPWTVKRFQAWDRWMGSGVRPSFLTSSSDISEIKKAEWKAEMKGPGGTRNRIENGTEHLHESWAPSAIGCCWERAATDSGRTSTTDYDSCKCWVNGI